MYTVMFTKVFHIIHTLNKVPIQFKYKTQRASDFLGITTDQDGAVILGRL